MLRPEILTDRSRLTEVYCLRVGAWQNSHNSTYVNSINFPNGWFDILDEHAFHWVIRNEKDEIIASARLNILSDIAELPFSDLFIKYISIFPKEFAFLSRLIVHPNYRGNSYSLALDLARSGVATFEWTEG